MATHEAISVAGRVRSGLAVVGSGAASGLIASLALSALILLAERVAGLPVGTFYLVLMSSITQAADYSVPAIAQGLLLHLAAGTLLGIFISAPFASRRTYSALQRFAPGLGLAAGVVIWASLFAPVTFGVMLPMMQSLDGQSVISQRVPAGNLFQIAVRDLLAMVDRVIYAALAFNMLYGLVALISTRSFSGSFMRKM